MTDRMRVGIVTIYHRNYNHGGLLQAFALQQVIEQMGYYCEVLTFDSPMLSRLRQRLTHYTPRQVYNVFSSKIKNRFLSSSEKREIMRSRKQAFEDFESTIRHSSYIKTGRFAEKALDYDVVVCGSDQVWNPAWWNSIRLLEGFDGSDVKKVSYAASIGRTSLSNKDSQRLKRSLSDFKHVSVREQSAVDLVQSICGGEFTVTLTLDPTLLLDRSEWLSLLNVTEELRIPIEPYAFIYMVDKQNSYTRRAIQICEESGMKSVVVSGKDYIEFKSENVTVLNDCKPSEWVKLIDRAEVVLTDSFHGTAFSVNFNKPFWCFRRPHSSIVSDDRQEGFLRRMGLEKRIIEPSKINTLRAEDDIEFTKSNAKLQSDKKASLEYLAESILS